MPCVQQSCLVHGIANRVDSNLHTDNTSLHRLASQLAVRSHHCPNASIARNGMIPLVLQSLMVLRSLRRNLLGKFQSSLQRFPALGYKFACACHTMRNIVDISLVAHNQSQRSVQTMHVDGLCLKGLFVLDADCTKMLLTKVITHVYKLHRLLEIMCG